MSVGGELQAVRVGIRGAWMRTPSGSSGHPWVSDVNSKRLEFRIEVRTLKVLEIKYSNIWLKHHKPASLVIAWNLNQLVLDNRPKGLN